MSRESELIPNSWSDEEAASYIQKYTKQGEDVALRVYTSRLIGRDPNCKILFEIQTHLISGFAWRRKYKCETRY